MATSISSGLLTAATTQINTGKNYLNGVIAITDGTNAATVTVYDGTDTNGIVLLKVIVPGANSTKDVLFKKAVRADTGLYVTISGTGAAAIVLYGAG